MGIQYRLARENDYEKINDFYNKMYGKSRTINEFRWAFHESPSGPAIYVIAIHQDEIIGTNCVIPIELKRSNEIILTGKSEDTLVHSDYRGKGVFENIYRLLFEECQNRGVQIIWGFTNARKAFLKQGFNIPFDNHQCIVVNDVFESYKLLKKGRSSIEDIKYLLFCLRSRFKLFLTKRRNCPFRLEVNGYNHEKVNYLLNENSNRNSDMLFFHQNKDYLNWRIGDNPYQDSTTYLSYYEGESLVGFVSLANKDGISYILQLLFSNRLSENDKTIILQNAMHAMFDGGAVMIKNWAFDTNKLNQEDITIHKNAGFDYLSRGQGFVWKQLSGEAINPNDFYLSQLASLGEI